MSEFIICWIIISDIDPIASKATKLIHQFKQFMVLWISLDILHYLLIFSLSISIFAK